AKPVGHGPIADVAQICASICDARPGVNAATIDWITTFFNAVTSAGEQELPQIWMLLLRFAATAFVSTTMLIWSALPTAALIAMSREIGNCSSVPPGQFPSPFVAKWIVGVHVTRFASIETSCVRKGIAPFNVT